jgi:uncharacterized protein YcsI (UPF0317 family)
MTAQGKFVRNNDGPAVPLYTSPRQFREEARGGFVALTRNQCPGYVQCGLVALPKALALDFMIFCQRNQKACPIIEVLEPGQVEPKMAAPGADVRTDLPMYSIYRDGVRVQDVPDVTEHWRDDLVTFVMGSNTSLDLALQRAGVQTERYRWPVTTKIPTVPAGPFHGPLVVTMRWLTPQEMIIATQLTSRFPFNHGAPIHVGDPAALGCDLEHPLTGSPPGPVPAGLIPTFWACVVTPQVVALAAKVEFMITSAPTYGLITDIETDKFGIP